MRGLLTRADVIVEKMSPERPKRSIVIAASVDNFYKLMSSCDGRRIEDHITQYARFYEIVLSATLISVPFKPKADIVGANCIWFYQGAQWHRKPEFIGILR